MYRVDSEVTNKVGKTKHMHGTCDAKCRQPHRMQIAKKKIKKLVPQDESRAASQPANKTSA
jgi:hypothetical protein